MPEHDLKLHLGCGPCRRALTISYHADEPPSLEDQRCPGCGELMDEIEHHPVHGRLTHPNWEEEA